MTYTRNARIQMHLSSMRKNESQVSGLMKAALILRVFQATGGAERAMPTRNEISDVQASVCPENDVLQVHCIEFVICRKKNQELDFMSGSRSY